MELLVITLVQANPAREADAMARMRLISESVRNAPGLLNARFYRGKEPDMAYCILTTWESTDWWQKAQEKLDPRALLLNSAPGVFVSTPDQWLMKYLWGYSRPLAQQAVAAAHLALIRPEMAALVEQSWLESLREQAIEPILSFALLARTLDEESDESDTQALQQRPAGQRPMFLNLLSWPGETYQEDFYTSEHYRTMQLLLNSAGFVRILKLDPL